MAQNFDKQVYALSVIKRVEYFPPKDSLDYFWKKADIKLLNFVALLLVTEDKGDVAAVAMEHLPNALNFYYSKNSPCPPQLDEHIQRLITLCASVEADGFMGLFFTEVLNSCRTKVRNRLNKCKRAIKSLGNIEFTGEVAAQEPYTAMHMDEYSGKSFSEVAQNFLKQLMDYEIEPHKGEARAVRSSCVWMLTVLAKNKASKSIHCLLPESRSWAITLGQSDAFMSFYQHQHLDIFKLASHLLRSSLLNRGLLKLVKAP